METFKVTRTAISQRKNQYIQLLMSDPGFMYVVPMKRKIEIVKSVEQFSKEVGVHKSFILDPEGT